MALQLPFATIPTIAFSSSKAIMGDFANGWKNQVVSILLSVVVIGINLYFVVSLVSDANLSAGWIALISKLLFLPPQLSSTVFRVFICSTFCHIIHLLQHLFDHPHDGFPRKLSPVAVQLRSEVCPKGFARQRFNIRKHKFIFKVSIFETLTFYSLTTHSVKFSN